MKFLLEGYKSLLFIALSFFILYSCSFSGWVPTSSLVPKYQVDRPADVASNQEPVVILYGTNWCYWCGVAKDFMKKNKIKFVEKNFDDTKEKEKLNKFAKEVGYDGRLNAVPIFVINKAIIVGYNPEQILCEIGRRKNCRFKLFTTWETPIGK